MKILVTGGAGFVGSHLVDKLIELGHSVDIIDNLSTGKEENLNPKARLTNWDISEMYFKYRPGELDYVFHLAALPSVPYSVEHPTRTHRVNVMGTYHILKSAMDSKVKKVIFASTCALYGSRDTICKEGDPLNPESPYAFHKATGEGYMRMFDRVYGLPTLSLRLFNVYGARSDPNSDYSLVMAKFLKLKKEGKPLTIYGNGDQTRDFVFVGDIVDAFILAMDSPVHNEVINICTSRSTSVNKLADLIGGEKQYLPVRKGDVQDVLGSNAKAQALLGWRPKTEIEEGIKKI